MPLPCGRATPKRAWPRRVGAVDARNVPAQFHLGHARQLDAVAGDLLTRAWAAGAGPGEEPSTIDVDSSIQDTDGLAKEGGTHFTYDHVRGYDPLYAVAAGTQRPARPPARWQCPLGRVRPLPHRDVRSVRRAGASGRSSCGPTRASIAGPSSTPAAGPTCPSHHGQFPQRRRETAIAGIDESAWVAISYFLDGADVAETT